MQRSGAGRIIAVGGAHRTRSRLIMGGCVPSCSVCRVIVFGSAVGGFHQKAQLSSLRHEIDGVPVGTALMRSAQPARPIRQLGFS